MISATRRNRFYAKRRFERMKRHPVWTETGSSICVCVLCRSGIHWLYFRPSFRRSRVPTAAFWICSQNRTWLLPKCSRCGHYIFGGWTPPEFVNNFICLVQNLDIPRERRDGAAHGGTAGRGGTVQDGTPTNRFAQETTVPRTLQGIEQTCPERFLRGTNKRNAM